MQEHQQGSDPNDYYSQGNSTIIPQFLITGGNQQSGDPGQFLAQPLTVKVTDSLTGFALANAPVTFSVAQGGGKLTLQPSLAVSQHDSLVLRTNTSGNAQVCHLLPAEENADSRVQASGGSGAGVQFTLTTGASSLPSAVINLVALKQEDGSVQVNWENVAINATSIKSSAATTSGQHGNKSPACPHSDQLHRQHLQTLQRASNRHPWHLRAGADW